MDMAGQPQLWTPALEAAHFQVHHDKRLGWEAHLVARRSGETWGDRPARFWGSLSTDELLDVVCAVFAYELGFGGDGV